MYHRVLYSPIGSPLPAIPVTLAFGSTGEVRHG